MKEKRVFSARIHGTTPVERSSDAVQVGVTDAIGRPLLVRISVGSGRVEVVAVEHDGARTAPPRMFGRELDWGALDRCLRGHRVRPGAMERLEMSPNAFAPSHGVRGRCHRACRPRRVGRVLRSRCSGLSSGHRLS